MVEVTYRNTPEGLRYSIRGLSAAQLGDIMGLLASGTWESGIDPDFAYQLARMLTAATAVATHESASEGRNYPPRGSVEPLTPATE